MRMKFCLLAGLATAAVLPSVALADPRDDVVAGMMRCAVIADDRQWLDCYYGAAQPMRSRLGLSPAPQAQTKAVQGGVAHASVAPFPGAPMPGYVQPGYAPTPAYAPTYAAPVRTGPPPPPRRSGLLNLMGGADVVSNAPAQSYDIGKGGRFTITLADGQVWRQTEEDAAKRPVHWRQPASEMQVTISQGAMHTFNLVLADETTHYKVQRVR